MPHPIEMVYRNTIKDVVRAFAISIPAHIQNSFPHLNEEKVAQFIGDYETLWTKNFEQILTAISRDISFYLNYYNIHPKGSIDEFKAVYFTGRVISRFLHANGLSELRELNDYVTIALLDRKYFLISGNNRPVLTNSLRKIAKENEIEKHLGAHGMYLIYKCACNVVAGK